MSFRRFNYEYQFRVNDNEYFFAYLVSTNEQKAQHKKHYPARITLKEATKIKLNEGFFSNSIRALNQNLSELFCQE